MASTFTPADIFGIYQGYLSPTYGTPPSPELLSGATTDGLVTGAVPGNIAWSVVGDHVSALASLTALKVNGTDIPVSVAPTYNSSTSSTEAQFGPASNFTVGVAITLELVFSGGGDTTPPTITSANTASNIEGTTLSHALTANESVTWSIVGGADQADFEISGSTLRWASNGTQSYASPADADANNVYVVTVRATDGASNTTDQTISVTVTEAYSGPTYIGKSTAGSGTGAISIDFTSSGRTTGDKLIIAIASANETIAAPSGYTETASSPQSRGTAAAAGGIRLALFEKTSDGTETTVSIADSGNHTYAVGFVLRKSALDTLVIDASAGNNVAATTSGSFGGVTTTGSNRLIIHAVATDRDSTAASWSGEANANLTNLTERHDAGTTSGQGSGIAIFTGEKKDAGATGSTTATQAASSAYCWITLAFGNAADVINHATTGALTGQIGSVVGSSARTRTHTSSGSLIGQIGSISGSSGHLANHTTSGALAGQNGALAGSSRRFRAHASSSALAGQEASISGDALRADGLVTHTTSGALAGQGSLTSGVASRYRLLAASGAITGQGSSLSGVSRHNEPHNANGSLAGDGSVLDGVSRRFRATTSIGVLIASGSAVDGVADRTVGAVSHATAGAIIGAGAALSGSGTRFRAFATNGTLDGQGSSIAGNSARSDGFESHDASGLLVGQDAQIDGAAIRYRVHGVSGVIAGAGSLLAGDGARFRALSAIGNMAGAGSAVDAVAVRQRVFSANGDIVGPPSSINGNAAQYAVHDVSGDLIGGGSIVIGDALMSGSIPVPDFLNCRFSDVEARSRMDAAEHRRRSVPVEASAPRIVPVEIRGSTILPIYERLRIIPIETRIRVVPVEATCD